MATTPFRQAVGNAAVKICENKRAGVPEQADFTARRFLLKNRTGTGSIYLGADNTVTSANGFEWEVADGPLEIELEPGEELWGIRATVDQTLHGLSQGR